MTKNLSTPAIRFKGFTDTWEQRELWELTIWDKKFNEVEAEKQPKIIKYPYVLADVFSKIEDASGDVRLLSTGNYIGYTTDEKAGKNLCVGEVVAIPWGGVPNIKYYKGKFVTADNRIATSNDTETLGNRFLSLYLEHSLAFLQSIYRGASIKHPSMNDVLSMQISIPHIQEQREIETWFANLDNLITLHQRKYDKLTNVKKSMLEKMFPKNGSNVPEIRFKGFTEAWEQRKLIDYLEVSSLKNKTGVYGKEDVLSVSGDFGIVNQIEFQGRSFAGASLANYGVVETGDIVYTKSPLKANPYGIIKANKGKAGIVSTLYAAYKPKENTDSTFVQIYFEQDARMNNYMQPLVNKGAKNDMKVSDENALKGRVSFPKKPEQIAISSYFESLDNLITLHQRELEKLKNLKKACLEKMFV